MATDLSLSDRDTHESITVAKVSAAAGLVTAAHNHSWGGDSGEAVKAAAKYLVKVFGSDE